MARKMASRELSTTRKAAVENVAGAKSGGDQDTKKKKTYKSTHCIGSRKATEKVVTYSETLSYFPEMVQQYINDRDMEPKKASPAKSPSAKSSPAKSTPTKSPPAKSTKTLSAKSSAKSSPARSSPSKSAAKTSPTKSPSPKSSSPAKSPSSKSPGSAASPAKSTNSKSAPTKAQGVKRKSCNDSPAKDVTDAKKPKLELDTKADLVVPKKAARVGSTDSKISIAEKLKQISAKAEAAGAKKKKASSAKQADSGKVKKKAASAASKDKTNAKSPDGKNHQASKKPEKKKPTKKKEEKEIPSLLSFIKPRREASLNANVMMDIMFEKPVSPKKTAKTVAPKSPSGVSPSSKTSPSRAEETKSKSARKKLEFDKDESKSSQPKKTKKTESQPAKSHKAASKTCKGSKSRTQKAGKVANGRVVKRKCKKRMASLNARALIVAERESLQVVLERAARTDRYCVSWVHELPQANRSPHRSARWVDGLGSCGVCNSKKDLAESVGVTEVSAPTLPLPESKLPLSILPAVLHDKDHAADDRPSSVVDVVTAHTPHMDLMSAHQPSVIDVVGPHSPVKAQVLGGNLGNFGGLFGHRSPCVGPCPGYSYSHTEGYVTTSASYQSFTLSGMGTLNAVPLVTPTFRPSAFSVPGYNVNVNVPYGYYPSGPYYQPAPSALLPQPLPEPCMVPHHLSIKVPHPQVKVLIHNPDTPQDLAAFSEHRSADKGDLEGVSVMGKITNDNNNNNNGSIRNNVSKSNSALNHSSQTGNGSKRASEKTAEKSSAKQDGSRRKEAGENKKKEAESRKKDANDGKKRENESAKKRDSDSNKNGKNGESNHKKGGENRNKKKEGEGVKKKNSHVVLKTKDGKVPKGAGPKQQQQQQQQQPKKKNDKKKKPSEKAEAAAQREETSEAKEESIPEHGWVWVGEPETKKVVSVHMDMPSEERQCYSAIRHSTHGDIIHVRDCVLLRSGCCKSDVPYVAKVGAFWEHPKTKEMMMSLLWYYQPEHTEAGRKPNHMENEVFASRHRDENSVACIDDKCYVLTYDQYCRYQAEMRRLDHSASPRTRIVPDLDWSDPEVTLLQRELPGEDVDPANIFCCRKVYDFRMKRILKNPS